MAYFVALAWVPLLWHTRYQCFRLHRLSPCGLFGPLFPLLFFSCFSFFFRPQKSTTYKYFSGTFAVTKSSTNDAGQRLELVLFSVFWGRFFPLLPYKYEYAILFRL